MYNYCFQINNVGDGILPAHGPPPKPAVPNQIRIVDDELRNDIGELRQPQQPHPHRPAGASGKRHSAATEFDLQTRPQLGLQPEGRQGTRHRILRVQRRAGQRGPSTRAEGKSKLTNLNLKGMINSIVWKR